MTENSKLSSFNECLKIVKYYIVDSDLVIDIEQVEEFRKKLPKLKIAVLHAFFVPKGGGEKLVFDIRNYYNADLYTGAINTKIWDKEKISEDSFTKALYDSKYTLKFLHTDVEIPYFGKILRQLMFWLHPQINELKKYDLVIFSGNIGLVPGRLKNSKPKLVAYCHTPPRPFTDQLESVLKQKSGFIKPFYKAFAKWVRWQYKKDMQQMDLVITNSMNTKNRLKKYIGLDSIPIFPAANTSRFAFNGQEDYYISWARLEPLKRLPLIIEAFAAMPDKKLILCSTGPLKDWVKNQIKERNLTNIIYEGLVTDERLEELVGKCIAGIYIPIDEDAGITQIEIMSAGKPVIGVNEGGLMDTVINGETGILIPKNPTLDDLISGINSMTPSRALSMKNACLAQAKKYDSKVFFEKMDSVISKLFI